MAHDPIALLAVVAVGIVAGFVNIMAGGGSLLAMPALILLGLPDTTANGTVRVAVLVQTATAVVRYARAGQVDWRLTWRLAAPTVLGAGLGAWLGAAMSDLGFRRVLSVAIIGAASLLVVQPWLPSWFPGGGDGAGRPRDPRTPHKRRWWVIAPVLFGVGIYGGMVQAGVGFPLLAALGLAVGLPLLQANIQKVAIVLCYAPLALGVFFVGGKVDLVAGGALALGQASGAWIAAGMALSRGAGFVRKVLAVVLVALVVRLLVT